MKNNLDSLKKCELFRGIEEKDIPAMLTCMGATEKHMEKQQTIFAEGDPARRIGIVLSGAVQLVQDDYYGKRTIVALMEPGQLFGETFACAGVEHLPVSMIAAAESDVLLLDCSRIIKTCSSSCEFHSRVIYNLLRLVARKNIIFNQKIELISKRTTRKKLMAFLLSQAKQHNSNTFRIPYDRQELADYLGVDRSALSAEISKLRAEGVIVCRRSEFTLL